MAQSWWSELHLMFVQVDQIKKNIMGRPIKPDRRDLQFSYVLTMVMFAEPPIAFSQPSFLESHCQYIHQLHLLPR